MTDLTNIMYCHADAVEKLTRIRANFDKQMVKDMKQTKELAADCDQKVQQLADFEAAVQIVVRMVEEGDAGDKSLLERLREAPQRLSSFFSETSREYLLAPTNVTTGKAAMTPADANFGVAVFHEP